MTNIDADEIATAIPENGVDDIYVAIVVGNIDGPGGRFAEAGQTLLSSGNIIGASIKIDPNDIQTVLDTNIFDWLMLHELGHVFGIGTLNEWFDRVDQGTYIGTNGLQAWRDIGCTGGLPLNGGDTAHWSEDCLDRELMTPLLQFNNVAQVSAITMGVLEDLGYVVNRDEQDAFGLENLDNCGEFCPAAARRRLDMVNATMTSPPLKPVLSEKAEMELLNAAAERFRFRDRRLRLQQPENGSEFSTGYAVSYIYEENGNYFSRTIHRSHVEHLL